MPAPEQTVKQRSIDWDDYVRRIRGPLPAKLPVYTFGGYIIKTEPRDHRPFAEPEE